MSVTKRLVSAVAAAALMASMALTGCAGGGNAPTAGGDAGTGGSGGAATELVEFDATSDALAALQAGNVEAVVFDEPVAIEQVGTTYTDAEIVEVIPTGEQYGFAVAKENPELNAAVNQALVDLKADGSFDTLFEKWFPGVSIPALTPSADAPVAPTPAADLHLVTPGVLTVGSDCDYPPFIAMEGETPVGFEYELMQEVGAKLGLEVVYLSPQNFSSIVASVAAATKMDIGVSSFTINDERLELVDFCIPYFDSNQAVVALKSKGYTSAEDLRGKKVASQSGTTGSDWVRENLM
ncbi:MAG: transporter substrate-binding domain-containing protein [Coriobacteriales bacterium]|nr:transporter substrate-binding domain-containing protein [Coriobacteriales bacterium]